MICYTAVMIGYKVVTKQGLKGPYQKRSILKAITSAQLPLNARLLDLETGRYLSAAELAGESIDPPQPTKPTKPKSDELTLG